jgi:hypothetical protein
MGIGIWNGTLFMNLCGQATIGRSFGTVGIRKSAETILPVDSNEGVPTKGFY